MYLMMEGEKTGMKKIWIGVFLIAILAGLSACGSRPEESTGESSQTESGVSSGSADEEAQGQDSGTDAGTGNGIESKDARETKTVDSEDDMMKITAGDHTFTAVLADNSSVSALKEMLAEQPLTIDMSDYASMEKVGAIGSSLPRNDEQISTGAGDIILYQGNSLVIYYDANSWNFTRIGKIEDVTREELLEALGTGDVTVTFSLD